MELVGGGVFLRLGFLCFFGQLPGPKVCFMKVFRYIKPTKKHSFGALGIMGFLVVFLRFFHVA